MIFYLDNLKIVSSFAFLFFFIWIYFCEVYQFRAGSVAKVGIVDCIGLPYGSPFSPKLSVKCDDLSE